MESARIETLLDQGWSLIGQLHQWMSIRPQPKHDQDDLVELIAGLQSFWSKADDLDMKRLARSSLILEQFFERLCAQTLEVETEYLEDLSDGITGLEDLLLEFEATGDEPVISHLDALLRLERRTSRKYSIAPTSKTIEISAIDSVPSRALTRVEPSGITSHHTATAPIVIPDVDLMETSERRSGLEMTKAPLRIEQTLVQKSERRGISRLVVSKTVSSLVADKTEPIAALDSSTMTDQSNSILILLESLFFRHLIELALQSAGYAVEVFDTADSKADSQVLILNYRAVLVTPSTASQRIEQIRQSRELGAIKVIGLRATDQHEPFPVDLDACVLKSKPQQLISVLDQLFNPSADFTRRIA